MLSNTDGLNHKNLEMHGFALITTATFTVVLKHQAINIHSAE